MTIGIENALQKRNEARPPCGWHRNRAPRPAPSLVGDKPDRAPLDAAEAGDDVARIGLLNLEEIALIDGLRDQFLHVVGLVRIVRHQRVERGVDPVRHIEGRPFRNALLAVGGQEIDQPAHLQQRLDIIVEGAIGTEDFEVWTLAPPSSSEVTDSLVTVFTTSGPVTNM